VCAGGTTRFMLLKTYIIKSNSKNTTKLHIASAYYPDSVEGGMLKISNNLVNRLPHQLRMTQRTTQSSHEPTLTPQSENPHTSRAMPRKHGEIVNVLRENIMEDMNYFSNITVMTHGTSTSITSLTLTTTSSSPPWVKINNSPAYW
jgi:hypothetical protein